MKYILRVTVVTVHLFFVTLAWAGLETKRDQLVALDAIIAELKDHYGMAHFKEEMFGVTIDKVAQKYRRLIRDAKTLEEDAGLQRPQTRELLSPDQFRQLMIGLAAEFKDGHTNIMRQSSSASTIGIRTFVVDEKLYVGSLDPDLYVPNSTLQPLQVGDEIVSVNGRPVAQLAKENLLYTNQLGATYTSALTMALKLIVNVPHALLPAKTAGEQVVVEFRKPGSKDTFTGRFHWLNTDKIMEAQLAAFYINQRPPAPRRTPYVYGDGSRAETYLSEGLKALDLPFGTVTDVAELVNQKIKETAARGAINANQASAPNKTEDVDPTNNLQIEAANQSVASTTANARFANMVPITRLPAYQIRTNGKTIGFLRIPNYVPTDLLGELRWLEVVLEYMQNTADVLVIDQLSNGGGSVFHAWQFLKFFATSTLKSGTIDIRLSDTLLNSLETPMTPDNPYAQYQYGRPANLATYVLQQDAIKALRAKKEPGEKFSGPVSSLFTNMTYQAGEGAQIVGAPNKLFTKPILLLNDGYSASGGDFVPWILQANKRAVIMGETSKGLGGPVYRSQSSMPGSEMTMRCTFGVCKTENGEPLENIGVVPDIHRPLSLTDVRNGYRGYAYDVLQMALMVEAGASPEQLQKALAERTLAQTPPNLRQLLTSLRETQAHIEVALEQATTETSIQFYGKYFESLKKVPADALNMVSWADLYLPLPKAMKAEDHILNSLRKMPEIRVRLEEMQNLKSNRSSQYKEVQQFLIQEIRAFEAYRNPSTVTCQQVFN
jgi:C-terminal processing protease CtpA/Prc